MENILEIGRAQRLELRKPASVQNDHGPSLVVLFLATQRKRMSKASQRNKGTLRMDPERVQVIDGVEQQDE